MASILISGSISFDTLLFVDDDIRETMRTDDRSISVGYHCRSRHNTYGGCAANMAFHLTKLGLHAAPIAAVGIDFAPYAAWLDLNGVDRSLIATIENDVTAHVYILTDAAENQVLAMYPGAMSFSKDIRLDDNLSADLAIVGPDDRDAFMGRVADFARFGIPTMLDPGQCLTSLTANDLSTALASSHWLIVNDFELSMVERLLNASASSIATKLEALIVTKGENGSRIYTNGAEHAVSAAKPVEIIDPTGCGDSFRAGLASGLIGGQGIVESAEIGAELAADTLARIGAQWQLVTDSIR